MEAGRRNTFLFLTCWKLELNHLYIWEFQVEVLGMEYIARGRS